FDQIDQKPIPDTLPIEENLPTEQEALQSIFTQPDNTEDMDDSQDP
ncbi:7175_t:CDS:1, partial [Racocetra fulgida]